jgi:hypothetical protein
MKRFMLASTMLLGLAVMPAKADVILDPHLSGTGDNVVFDSVSGNVAFGSFNGQHSGFAQFTDLSGNSSFTGAANGNDIKISNTSDLQIVVFGTDKTTVLGTATDVFSLIGNGVVTASVVATDGTFSFNLGTINGAQSGFTLSAINGEVISKVTLNDVGGVITDFEHYRIDVASVPGPVIGAGLPGLAGGLLLLLGKARQRRFWWKRTA